MSRAKIDKKLSMVWRTLLCNHRVLNAMQLHLEALVSFWVGATRTNACDISSPRTDSLVVEEELQSAELMYLSVVKLVSAEPAYLLAEELTSGEPAYSLAAELASEEPAYLLAAELASEEPAYL